MMRALRYLLPLLLLPWLAAAQPVGTPSFVTTTTGALSVTGNATVGGQISGNVTATGATTARTLADRAADIRNIADFGVVGDGTTDDKAAIQAALNAIPASGGTVFVPAKRYASSATLVIKSNTRLVCSQGATFVPTAGFTGTKIVLSNPNYAASVITDHDIAVEGCAFDLTNQNVGNAHAINFRMVSHVRIIRPQCLNGGDCTAMLATRDTVVQDGHATGILNACWDHWDASTDGSYGTDGTVSGGYCESNHYGALITGTNTAASSAGVAQRYTINGGSYVMAAASQAGIWVNGIGAAGSGAANVRIIAPNITMGAGTAVCIKVSGGGTADTQIISPSCVGASSLALVSSSGGDTGGLPRNTKITNALLDGVGNASQPLVQLFGTGDSIIGTTAVGGTYTYGITLAGTGQFAANNAVPTGSSGVYSLGGATSWTVVDPAVTQSWTPSLRFGGDPTGITYSIQTGSYWIVGRTIQFCGAITLTSKGAAVGNAAIVGLPFVAGTQAHGFPVSVSYAANLTTSPATPALTVSNAGQSIGGSTDVTQGTALANTHFANGTGLGFCGSYAIN